MALISFLMATSVTTMAPCLNNRASADSFARTLVAEAGKPSSSPNQSLYYYKGEKLKALGLPVSSVIVSRSNGSTAGGSRMDPKDDIRTVKFVLSVSNEKMVEAFRKKYGADRCHMNSCGLINRAARDDGDLVNLWSSRQVSGAVRSVLTCVY